MGLNPVAASPAIDVTWLRLVVGLLSLLALVALLAWARARARRRKALEPRVPKGDPGETAAFEGGREISSHPRQMGPYCLLEQLGQGGMGAVYRAEHVRLKRTVAVKVLPPGLLHDTRAVARFRREVEAVGKLDHPNIGRASDAGEASGWPFLVMELIDGVDLAKLAARLGTLPVADACEVCRQAALALQHAHEHGLVHRDIKPGNLMLTPAGVVKLLDLGLARVCGDQPVSEVLTATGVVIGTPDYMAPEQATEPRSADIRADLYGLGCTLYRLLTGVPPFGGPGQSTLAQKLLAHALAPVPPIRDRRPEVPEGLAALLVRLLAKSPADRPATPAEVEAALRPFAAGQDLVALYAAASGQELASPPGPTQDYIARSQRAREPDAAIVASTQSPSHRAPSAGRRRWRRLPGTAAGWSCLLCVFGLACFIPSRDVWGPTVIKTFATWESVLAVTALLCLLVVLLATGRLKPVPLWRPAAQAITGVVVAVVMGTFLANVASENPILSVPQAYWIIAAAIGLVLLGAFEIRGLVVQGSRQMGKAG
jgi:serine/threonine protein kinase